MNAHFTALMNKHLPDIPFERSGNALLLPIEREKLPEVIRTLTKKFPLMTMFASQRSADSFHINYVFGVPREVPASPQKDPVQETIFLIPYLSSDNGTFPSLAREFPSLALYEREIQSLFGLIPEGHPDPRSLILHEENWPQSLHPLRKEFAWNARVPDEKNGTYRFNKVGGEGIYEIPVGPVHAGIIEPGHFRFSVAGEEIISLEARLGWVHKGTEKLFEILPMEKKISLAEHVSGDSSFSHALAFCEAVEKLSHAKVPPRARYLRLIFGELERVLMHTFDIGNIAGNGTGFTFMAAHGCGEICALLPPLMKKGTAIGVVEGWRGEIVYAVQTQNGIISRVKVRDPSFIHWQPFSHLSSNDMVPDFPLINKSFNLSYSGNDL